jgi:hypothetical protein
MSDLQKLMKDLTELDDKHKFKPITTAQKHCVDNSFEYCEVNHDTHFKFCIHCDKEVR